jgi:hypothetical protein
MHGMTAVQGYAIISYITPLPFDKAREKKLY